MANTTGGILARLRWLLGRATALLLRLYAIEFAAAFLVFLVLAALALWGLFQPHPPPPTLR
jgi:hypothetical protein